MRTRSRSVRQLFSRAGLGSADGGHEKHEPRLNGATLLLFVADARERLVTRPWSVPAGSVNHFVTRALFGRKWHADRRRTQPSSGAWSPEELSRAASSPP